MATHGDTLSTLLLVIAVFASGSATLGALALGALELKRRLHGSPGTRGESSTFRFRMPVAPEPPAQDIADPTDRFDQQPLFGAQPAANDDPFEGDDTVPVLEPIRRRERVASSI